MPVLCFVQANTPGEIASKTWPEYFRTCHPVNPSTCICPRNASCFDVIYVLKTNLIWLKHNRELTIDQTEKMATRVLSRFDCFQELTLDWHWHSQNHFLLTWWIVCHDLNICKRNLISCLVIVFLSGKLFSKGIRG